MAKRLTVVLLCLVIILVSFFVGTRFVFAQVTQTPQVIGFQPYWLIRNTDNDYTRYINHFSYFGLAVGEDGHIQKLINEQEEEPGWTTMKGPTLNGRIEEMKAKNLKVSLLVHNANEDTIIALMENPEEHAQNLIDDVAPIMRKYGFNDLNVDIESFIEASPEKQAAFTQFVEVIRAGVDKNNLGTITIDVSPTALVKPFMTDIPALVPLVDYMVFMTYDFHYTGSFLAGPVAPVGGAGQVRELDVKTSIDRALNVVPPEKFILGIPLYGYEWLTLSDTPGAPTIPGGGVTASNRRVTDMLKDCDECKSGFDEISQQPYVIFEDPDGGFYHQIFYEDKKSLQKKTDLAKQYNLGGLALWALGYEGEDMLEPLKDYIK